MSHSRSIVHQNYRCSAMLYHYPAGMDPDGNVTSYHLGMVGAVYDANTNQPVNVNRIALIMGVGGNYHPGWDIENDARMSCANCNHFALPAWNAGAIDQDEVGGDALFDLPDGSRQEIRGLRIKKPTPGFIIRLPDITIPFE